MIQRNLARQILDSLSERKIIHIPGPRQVGKTTLLKSLEKHFPEPVLWLNGDEADVRSMFSNITSTSIRAIIGHHKTLVIDEAQRIIDIGIILKLIHDNIQNVCVVVSGSSSFELANKINEPLTGRKTELFLYPLSFDEMANHSSLLEENRMLQHRLVYGYYPEVVTHPGKEKAVLKRLTDAYLYKDLFALETLKKPPVLEKLITALAFQIGQEVSYNEIAKLIGIDHVTVEKYIGLLEQSYIIFKLNSLSRNLRNEIRKGKKIYFYDNGIRNAIIKNFSPLELRNDTGALWENFIIAERQKVLQDKEQWVNRYFWRTHGQAEVDYIEEADGQLFAFEFKWGQKRRSKLSKTFMQAYPNHKFKIITPENYREFIT